MYMKKKYIKLTKKKHNKKEKEKGFNIFEIEE